MRYTFLFLGLFMSSLISAQEIILPCQFGQSLLTALRSEYRPASTLGYGPARDVLYSEIDNNGTSLSGIYTNFTITLNPAADPSSDAFGKGINAEHVYPQSLGAANEPAKSDMHNIFPSKINVNADRAACAFRDILDTDTEIWYYDNTQTTSIPTSNIDLYSEKDQESCFFEPRESVKGNIARAMFYFYAIYQPQADAESSSFIFNQRDVLLQWHLNDPVDDVESRRDSLIALEQGNHNPFILDPTLVERAYVMADASYPDGSDDCFTGVTSYTDVFAAEQFRLASNLVQDQLTLFSSIEKGNILIYDLQGRLFKSTPLQLETSISVNDLSQGLYLLQVQTETAQTVFRFYKQ